MRNGLIVTGTDTGVGKTVFCAALVDALGADYWKPVQAGLDQETDRQAVGRLANVGADRLYEEAYRLNTACSPHRAAEIDGVGIELSKLAIPTRAATATASGERRRERPLVVEGAGGLLVPLSLSHLQIDQFAIWGLPVVLCARTGLGTINHTLLSVEAISSRGLPFAGIAFIGGENIDTQRTIGALTGAKVLGRLGLIDPLDHVALRRAFAAGFHAPDFSLGS